MYNQEADYDKINKEILLKLGKVLLRGLKSWLSPIFHVILFNTLVLLGVFFLFCWHIHTFLSFPKLLWRKI